MIRKCHQCSKNYKTTDHRRKFCSNNCYWKKSSKIGNIGQFGKGFIPWNKGKKGIHLSPKSEFKKGQNGINRVDVGTITKRKDKNGLVRKYIKVKEPNVWIEYYRYLWESAGKKFKKGWCVHHINNDSTDDRIENLILVSRQDHPRLHNRWNTKNPLRSTATPSSRG